MTVQAESEPQTIRGTEMPNVSQDEAVPASHEHHASDQLSSSHTVPRTEIVSQDGIQEKAHKEPITKPKPEDIPPEIRAELARLSSGFLPAEKINVSASLPLPETIRNKKTKFLALGKCIPYQDFLYLKQLWPAVPTSLVKRPMKLTYDDEWLAILRVFAPELHLGGRPEDLVPQHRGDTYYRERIIVEEKWIEENVVKAGKMEVPENFTITAPVYNPDLVVSEHQQPREYTNPQTSTFCALIGIENPFDISEEQRDARMTQGPRADRPRGGHRGRGGGDRSGAGRGGGGSRNTPWIRRARESSRGRGGRVAHG